MSITRITYPLGYRDKLFLYLIEPLSDLLGVIEY
jgi:hypothetical protein